MKKLVSWLPILILLAFPVLYFGGHSDSAMLSVFGILLLLIGMSGSICKRFFGK